MHLEIREVHTHSRRKKNERSLREQNVLLCVKYQQLHHSDTTSDKN